MEHLLPLGKYNKLIHEGIVTMYQTLTYTYEILTAEEPALIAQAADCLATTFIGVDVAGMWIQEPITGYLDLMYEDFYEFTHRYLQETVAQGYCAIALDDNQRVVGVLAGDIHKLEVIEHDVFHGRFADMNIVLRVLEDIGRRFIEDYEQRLGRPLAYGDILHLFLLGVRAERERHEIVQQLGELLIKAAQAQGVKAVLGEATNPKSMRVMEKYHQLTKYVDRHGQHIVHKYAENPKLNGIPEQLADGTYIIIREL